MFVQRFWMKSWGHATPKRTCVYSNSAMIRMLDTGPLTREELVPEYATTRKYINGKGVKRFSGNSTLKGAQHPGLKPHRLQ